MSTPTPTPSPASVPPTSDTGILGTLRSLIDNSTFLAVVVLALTVAYFVTSSNSTTSKTEVKEHNTKQVESKKETPSIAKTASAMSAPAVTLLPPKSDPISPSELAQHDGSDLSKPIWVAIKKDVFDVSHKKEMYGPGASYNIFAGKDGSVGLGKSSLKIEDAIPDYTTLDAAEMKVLDQWYDFFKKRYNIIGRVSN